MTAGFLYRCWCSRLFRGRRTGGRAQRFCQPACRRAFHAAARAWALDAIAAGILTVTAVRTGLLATRALAPFASAAMPIDEMASRCHGARLLARRRSKGFGLNERWRRRSQCGGEGERRKSAVLLLTTL